jgi:hypothetical protein
MIGSINKIVLVINACLLRGFSVQVLAGLINQQLKPVYYALIKFQTFNLQNENSEDNADMRKAHKTCFWRSLRVILLAFEL